MQFEYILMFRKVVGAPFYKSNVLREKSYAGELRWKRSERKTRKCNKTGLSAALVPSRNHAFAPPHLYFVHKLCVVQAMYHISFYSAHQTITV